MAHDPSTECEGIELSDSRRRIVFTWGDGKRTEVPYREMRLACRCAGCVDELTGKPILDPRTVPEDIGVAAAEPVGLYGLRFDWTDGHGTGIYTWEKLRPMGTVV